jgi:outer membrane protein TolC
VLRVRARRRAREADLAAKRSDLVVAEAMLRRLMGEPDGPAFELTETPRPASAKDSLETWMAKALSRRPALRAAAGQRSAAALERRIEERASWPDLAGQARVMDDRTSFSGGGRSWAIGAVLRWSFFDATRQKRVSAAVADERAAAFDEQASRDLVRFQVGAAFSRLTAASERLAAAEGGALEGREALRIVQERRAQGLATLTDELETEAAAFAAELEEISAAKETVMAEAALRRAAGQSPWSVIQ